MKPVAILSLFAASLLALAGCRGIPAPGEKQARHDLAVVTNNYRPTNQPPVLPQLSPESSLSNFVAYALLNSPSVSAAFYDWSASVENITITRSRPDPQLTFQAYITDSLISLMPGLTWNFPGHGKLNARARVATAASQDKYFTFETAVLQTAFNLKTAYYKLGLLQQQLQLNRESLALVNQSDQIIQVQSQTAQAPLSDVLRVQSACARARTDLENLEASRRPLLENFKAALGLSPNQPDPPVPAHFESGGPMPDAAELLAGALANNPQLQALAADVRAAEAGIALAYKERVPDFNAGLQAEVYRPPFYWPQANMTLPIWRDKIAAEIAQAKAAELAAKSRLTAARIELVVSFAEKSFAYGESSRNLALVENELVPRARQSVDLTRAGYEAGTVGYSTLTDARQMLVALNLEAAQARTDREIALAELSLMVAGLPPPDAPLLPVNSQTSN